MKNAMHVIILMLVIFVSGQQAFAQESLENDEIVNVEGLYTNPPASSVPVQTPKLETEQESENANIVMPPKQNIDVNELKDLSRLAPFSEVSVIQRKFLPKTGRFQAYLGAGLLTNTPWYNNVGAKLHLGYNFTETLGLEINTSFLTNSESQSVKEIRDNNGLNAEQFIYTKNYYGLDLVWSPIYGKMTSLDRKIIPFDMYFAFGAGTSVTNSQEANNTTLHVGVGQIFAITKAMAFRWDYSFNAFRATPVSIASGASPSTGNYNDLILTAGISFFFPEAKYR